MKLRRAVLALTISLLGVGLVPAPAHACMGEMCDVVNHVCDVADGKKDYHWHCVA